jgi:hypothetical protein
MTPSPIWLGGRLGGPRLLQPARVKCMKQPLSAAGHHALRDEFTRTIEPARALAAETLTLERTLKANG